MKRLHLSFTVSDLEASVRYYSALFDTEPAVQHNDYAKWLLDDPQINFVVEKSGKKQPGLTHAGLQTDSGAELSELFERMQNADAPYFSEGTTTCCYARSDKSWSSDPDGLSWEAFLTHEQTETRTGSCC